MSWLPEWQGGEGGGEVRAVDDRRKWVGPGNKHAETTQEDRQNIPGID